MGGFGVVVGCEVFYGTVCFVGSVFDKVKLFL